MANIERSERRDQRLTSNNTTVLNTTSGLHLFEKIHTLAPFLKQLLLELGTKYAKIKCSISNIHDKLTILEEHKRNITLPSNMHHQQKFINSIENMDTKTEMINHLLSIEITKLQTIRENLLAKQNDRCIELQSHLDEGTSFQSNIETLKKYFEASIENSYHSMKLKMFKDKQKHDEKQKRFEENKEKENAEVTIKAKDIKKLLKEIESLKLQQKRLSKNVKGKTTQKKKSTVLPKKPVATKAKGRKTLNKSKKGTNTNGKKKSSARNQRH